MELLAQNILLLANGQGQASFQNVSYYCITVILKRSKFVRKVKDIRKLTERRLEEWKKNKFDMSC